MRTSFTLFCILITTITGFSQDKSFDLSKYKFPDYKRHELEFNFSSNGSSSSWSAINGLNPDGTRRTVDYKDVYNNSNTNLSYRFTTNNRKKQENIYSYFASSYRFDKSVDELGTTTFSSPNAIFSISAEEKYYLTENKWFIEVDPEFRTEIWSANYKFPNAVNNGKSRGNSFNAQIGLGGGIGRMEYVSDYWQAYCVLEEFKKQGVLVRNPEEKDINEFAALASQLKSKRFFDFRLKKIEEMKSLDSLMHENHLIEQGDISYFSILSDYWNFANISYRSSGRVLKILMTPMVSHRFDKQLDGSKQTNNETYLKSEINFQCSKQLNLYWERNFNLNFSNMTTIDNDDNSFYEYPKNFLQINSNVGWNYYPNFRTQFRTMLSYHATQLAGDLNQALTAYGKVWLNNVELNSSIYYYLSPQLRINGNISADYYDKKIYTDQKEKLDIYYTLGFQYSIF